MSNWFYIGAAYIVTWVTLAVYAIYLGRRRARADADWLRVDAGKGRDLG